MKRIIFYSFAVLLALSGPAAFAKGGGHGGGGHDGGGHDGGGHGGEGGHGGGHDGGHGGHDGGKGHDGKGGHGGYGKGASSSASPASTDSSPTGDSNGGLSSGDDPTNVNGNRR